MGTPARVCWCGEERVRRAVPLHSPPRPRPSGGARICMQGMGSKKDPKEAPVAANVGRCGCTIRSHWSGRGFWLLLWGYHRVAQLDQRQTKSLYWVLNWGLAPSFSWQAGVLAGKLYFLAHQPMCSSSMDIWSWHTPSLKGVFQAKQPMQGALELWPEIRSGCVWSRALTTGRGQNRVTETRTSLQTQSKEKSSAFLDSQTPRPEGTTVII